MGQILGYSFDRLMYQNKNKKRILKHRKLMKELFDKLAKETLGDNYKTVKFRVSYKSFYSGNCSKFRYKYYTHSNEIVYMGIKIDLQGLCKNVYCGYESDYYKCRADRLNRYIKGNRKNARLFVMYHELAHAKLMIEKGVKKYKEKSLFRKETEADIYALSKIKGA